MLILAMKRIIVFALAIFAFFTAAAGKGQPDSYEAYDFPIIKAEKQAPCTLRIMSFNIRVGGVNGNTTYNEYLGNFIITYLHEGKGLVMREGLAPWDGWSEEYLLASPSEYPALYGGYMCPKYTEENGRVFYFAMSQYLPVYNIMWMRAEMPEKQSAPF